MASKRMKKRNNRKSFIKRTLEILKIAERLAAVISILVGWDKWKWGLF